MFSRFSNWRGMSFGQRVFLASAVTLLAALQATAQQEALAPKIPAGVFAQLPKMAMPRLSPDANHIAYLAPIQGKRNLIITPIDGSRPPEAIPAVEETDISWFEWVNNERLVVSYRYTNTIGGDFVRTALFSVHIAEPGYVDMAREPRERDRNPRVRARPQMRDRVIDFLPNDPDHILLAIDSDFDGRAEIRRVNVATGRYVNITEGYDWIRHWVTDQSHQYRLGWGIARDGLRVLYIDPKSNSHRELNDVSWFEDYGIKPQSFTADPTIAYATEPVDGDKIRLITFNVSTGQRESVVFEHPSVDVGGYLNDTETQAVIGVFYTDDLPRVEYFDPELKALKEQLDEWLPGGSNSIISWNREKQRYVIRRITPQETAFYYMDKKSGTTNLLARSTPVPSQLLGRVEAHDIPTRDGLSMRSYLTFPKGRGRSGLPLVVLPHGGPHARDVMSYDYWAQFLANRGYAVLQPNFRGSAGFGERFRLAGEGQWGGKMQDDVTDATRWAIQLGIADPERVCIVGGSYGGYAAMMGAIKEPDLYRCAASINGVADLAYMVGRLKNGFWMHQYAKTVGLEGEGVKAVSPYHRAEELQTPLLIVHAKDDPIVPFDQAKRMRKRLSRLKKDFDYTPLETADHYFDTAESRTLMLQALETFLAKHLK